MATERQVNANRANAKKSTGPVTPEGKSRVALNALKHGLSAQTLLLTNESRPRFDNLIASLAEHYGPANAEELACIEEMAAARWRQRRAWAISAALLDDEMDRQAAAADQRYQRCDEATRTSIAFRELADRSRSLREAERQHAAAERHFDRALARLRALQARRPESENFEISRNEANSSAESTPCSE